MTTRLLVAYALIALVAVAALIGGWLIATASGRSERRQRERERVAAEQRSLRGENVAGTKSASISS